MKDICCMIGKVKERGVSEILNYMLSRKSATTTTKVSEERRRIAEGNGGILKWSSFPGSRVARTPGPWLYFGLNVRNCAKMGAGLRVF